MLGAEADTREARIAGNVQDLWRRMDALLDDLLPPATPPGLDGTPAALGEPRQARQGRHRRGARRPAGQSAVLDAARRRLFRPRRTPA